MLKGLTQCKKCGNVFNADMTACPKCSEQIKKKSSLLPLIFFALIIMVIIGAIESSDERHENAVTATRIDTKKRREKPVEIHEYAVFEMDRKDWGDTYKKWGNEWMKKLNALQHNVAEHVSYSKECDRVDLVGLDTANSIPKKKAIFYVDCANKKRFYISEEDLNSDAPAMSLQERNARITDATAIETCTNLIRLQLNHPSTFNTSLASKSVYRAPQGNIVANIKFSAKNALGLEKKYRARCVFDETNIVEPEISEEF